MSITMIIRNTQGASDLTKHTSRDEARDHLIATWADPENLTVQLLSEGETLWKGPAIDLVSGRDE